MGEGGITGGTTVKLYDHFRARLAATNLYLVGGVLVLAVAYAAFPTRRETSQMTAILNAGILLAIVAVCAAVMAVIVNVIVAAITAARLRGDQKVIAYQMDDRGLTMSDLNGSAVTTPWNIVKSVREDSIAFCFRVRPAGARYVPKRAFAPADIAAIRVLLAEKLGRAARLKV